MRRSPSRRPATRAAARRRSSRTPPSSTRGPVGRAGARSRRARSRPPARGPRTAARARCPSARRRPRRREPDPRQPVELRVRVAERERDGIGEARAGRRPGRLVLGPITRRGRGPARRSRVDRACPPRRRPAAAAAPAARPRGRRVIEATIRASEAAHEHARARTRASAAAAAAAPRMSVMKPGVSSSAPPKITSAPSITSRAGGRPRRSASLKRRHVRAALRAQQQRAEHRVGDQQRDRPPDADQLADLDEHRQLGDRDDDEEDDQEEPHRSLHGTRRGRRGSGDAGAGPASRDGGQPVSPTSSISRRMCGCGAGAATACGPARAGAARGRRGRPSARSRRTCSSERSTITSRVAPSARESGRRRRPLVVRSSSPEITRIAELFVETRRCAGTYTIPARLVQSPVDTLAACRRRRGHRGAVAT